MSINEHWTFCRIKIVKTPLRSTPPDPPCQQLTQKIQIIQQILRGKNHFSTDFSNK